MDRLTCEIENIFYLLSIDKLPAWMIFFLGAKSFNTKIKNIFPYFFFKKNYILNEKKIIGKQNWIYIFELISKLYIYEKFYSN